MVGFRVKPLDFLLLEVFKVLNSDDFQTRKQAELKADSLIKKRIRIQMNIGCIPVHLDFIVPVHLEHHTSGSSRPSYLWYIQSFHTSGSSRFHSYIWFIQIFFHTSGSSRTSYFWFIQIFFIPLVHLELHTSGSSRVFLPVSACKLHIRSKFGQI